MQRFHKACCYFGQYPTCKGSISRSNFDEQMPDVLFAYVFLCVRVRRTFALVEFQSARGLYYFLVWWDSKFYARIITVRTFRKKGEIKTVSVLIRLPSSLVLWCILNYINAWGRESVFSVDCSDGCIQKKRGEKLLRYSRREC